MQADHQPQCADDRPSRRQFLGCLAAGGAAALLNGSASAEPTGGRAGLSAETSPHRHKRVPVINTTDLYHPYWDVGDNIDLVAAYGLPEIDLRAIVLDTADRCRQPPEASRDAGFIPVLQLNSIFDRNVPFGITPYVKMRSPGDKMLDSPRFQQEGIELILRTLRESKEKIDITIFGSAKSVAAAFNRDPDLVRAKALRIHLCAGASSPEFLEWNVELDPNPIVCLLRSDLPIVIYPCATKEGPYGYGPNNTFWKLANLEFIAKMNPKLRRFLVYALAQTNRVDFLRALDEDPPADVQAKALAREHFIWETAVWMQIADLRLVRRADGHFRIISAKKMMPTDTVLPGDLRPCRVQVRDTGIFEFQWTDAPTTFLMYDRGDPKVNEQALREALPELYVGFRP